MTQKIKKAIIPAAGLGTRNLPATKVVPKELLPIVDRPSIQLIVEEGIQAGVEEFIFVISKSKHQVLDHFLPHPDLEENLKSKEKFDLLQKATELQDKAKFSYVYQEEPLGLGHAVLCAKEKIDNEWFYVFLPDDLIDNDPGCATQMLEAWQKYQSAIVAVMEVPWDQVHQYGIVKGSPIGTGLGKIEDVVEKPKREEAPSNLCIIGRYLLPPEVFNLLEKTKPGAIGEIQLTDALKGLIKKPELLAFQFEGERFDTGHKYGFIEANLHYALKDPDIENKVKDLIQLLSESR
jgi:UTP--glucose-1-phosphate uridylyltransferase